jgi:hypothetical protein
MPYFTTFDDPVHDLGGVSNITPPSRWIRPLIAAFSCSLRGHDWRSVGYANAHKYSHLQWQIGLYDCCSRCHARRFNLESKEQFNTVLSMELARWKAHFAKTKAEDRKLISEALR